MSEPMELYMKSSTTIIIACAVALLAVLAFSFLNMREERSFGEKVGDATESMSDGLTEAGRSFEDRTPAEKMRDGASDAADEVRGAVE